MGLIADTPVSIAAGRTRHAVVAVLMQLLVSLSYSYSVFRVPLSVLHGWTKAQTIAPYRYMLLMIAVGTVVGGTWQDRKGGRVVASAGGVLIGAGCLLAAWVGNSITGLTLTFGMTVGLGVGLAYVTPIANLLRWFPDQRGKVVGLAVMGSGFSALFWGPLVEQLIGKNPSLYAETVPRTFVTMAIIFSVAVIGMAQLYRLPPENWKPANWTPPAGVLVSKSLSTREMFGTWQFYALWLTYFLGSSVGLTAIGEASPMLQEVGRAGAPISSGIGLGIIGICNACGRLAWGSLSDRLGRLRTLLLMSAVSMGACLGILSHPSGFWMALSGLCIAAIGYAGYLALMPALTADYFGPKNVGGNYGILFTAWGICGFIVPGYFEELLDRAREAGNLADGYRQVYFGLAAIAAAVGLLALFLRPPRAAASTN
jgi:OFA family oxalate/formate antiporter-like MFS transporter